jgi:hypothetical protein
MSKLCVCVCVCVCINEVVPIWSSEQFDGFSKSENICISSIQIKKQSRTSSPEAILMPPPRGYWLTLKWSLSWLLMP